MKKSNKILVAIIIVLIILMLAGSAFAYLYVATDTFKTDKEMFFKYFAQLTSEEGFLDKRIEAYYEKKKQNAYENSGKITVAATLPDANEVDLENVMEKVNDLRIKFSGKVDSVNKKVDQNIEIDYGNNVIFPINYRQDGDKFGLQTDELSKLYIGVKNENIEELISKVSGDSIVSMPQRIDGIMETISLPVEIIKGINFSEEEKNQLKQIYGTILEQQLIEEKFSSIKTEKNESFILQISSEEIKNIIIKMLEATKENTLIIDKINEAALKVDSSLEKMDASNIDEIIESINEEENSETTNIKITLVQSNKMLNQIIIENEETTMTITKSMGENTIEYNISLEIKENENIEENQSLLETKNSSSMQTKAYLNFNYNGLDNLTDIKNNYKVGYANIKDDETVMVYDYTINCNTKFAENVSIDNLDNDVAVFLNDYDETKLSPFLVQFGNRLASINKKHMAELGLEEEENPLLYSNPITAIVAEYILFSKSLDAIENNNFSEAEVSIFNNKFELYEGDAVKGSEVNALVRTVLASNLESKSAGLSPSEGEKFVSVSGSAGITLNVDDTIISTQVDSSNIYKVRIIYDATTGFVSNIQIDEQY